MSVDQTGEDILFVMEPGMGQAHIEIQYKGDAAHFSWVLPVQALPDVQVGSQALFDRLRQATVPRYGYTTQRDLCGTGVGGSTGTGGGGGGFPGGGADAAAAVDSGVNIVFQKVVGAFDVIVLLFTPLYAASVPTWLWCLTILLAALRRMRCVSMRRRFLSR
jgi:hypothetical protein